MANGRVCRLCGAGGCQDFIDLELGRLKITVYICSKCKVIGYEESVKKVVLRETQERRASGKSP
jgi:hypothetical protein